MDDPDKDFMDSINHVKNKPSDVLFCVFKRDGTLENKKILSLKDNILDVWIEEQFLIFPDLEKQVKDINSHADADMKYIFLSRGVMEIINIEAIRNRDVRLVSRTEENGDFNPTFIGYKLLVADDIEFIERVA